jgi:predicted Zn-dependent protease
MPDYTTGTSGETVAYYEAGITAKWGQAAGNAYVAYAAAHPGLTAEQSFDDFVELILVEGLDKAVDVGVTGGTNVDVGTAEGAAQGAENAVQELSPTGVLDKLWSVLSSRGTWVRIAEGVLGIALVLVAVSELGKGTPVGNAVKKVPFI